MRWYFENWLVFLNAPNWPKVSRWQVLRIDPNSTNSPKTVAPWSWDAPLERSLEASSPYASCRRPQVAVATWWTVNLQRKSLNPATPRKDQKAQGFYEVTDVWWNITLFFTSTYHWNKWIAYKWLISRDKQAQRLQKDLATIKSTCSKTVKHIQLGDYGCYWVQIKLADFWGHICKQHKIFNHHT